MIVSFFVVVCVVLFAPVLGIVLVLVFILRLSTRTRTRTSCFLRIFDRVQAWSAPTPRIVGPDRKVQYPKENSAARSSGQQDAILIPHIPGSTSHPIQYHELEKSILGLNVCNVKGVFSSSSHSRIWRIRYAIVSTKINREHQGLSLSIAYL